MKLPRLIWVLNTVLFLVLVGLIARQTMRRPADADTPQFLVPDGNLKPTSAPGAVLPALDQTPARNIFGGSSGPGGGETPAVSTMPLRLRGTVSGSDAVARAIIEDVSSHAQDIYKVGDSVIGAQIESIGRNSVVLLRDGRRELLEVSLAPGDAPAPGPKPAAVMTSSDVLETVKATSPTDFMISKKALLARIGGMEAILNSAKIAPYIVDGQAEGLRITGLDGISMARFIGLEDGDVVQNVNGQKLTSVPKAFQVFQKARTQQQLDVVLLRGQDKKKLSFRLGN